VGAFVLGQLRRLEIGADERGGRSEAVLDASRRGPEQKRARA